MATRESSSRYPWPVRTVEELAREMCRAASAHGRISLCGWYCAWLPEPRRVVRWDEATQIVESWRLDLQRKDEKAE